jgi:predicted AlkP superfamily phosphohydrolase/phosphomutase/tetratricopeptide (TPR) repeat protein
MKETVAKNKVLLIGWDAADWEIINPLLKQNKLPALQKLINEGSAGKIESLQPMLSPMLWTSIATGTTADKHGILGFTEVKPDGSGIQPITINSRKVKAIWNILHEHGYKCNVISWWPSYPAEEINGIVTTEYLGYSTKNINQDWPVISGSVHPTHLAEKIGRMRVHPQELTFAQLSPFFNDLQNINKLDNELISSFVSDLARDVTTHNIVTWALEYTNWDFTAVYYNGLDSICHSFARYMPPRQTGISDEAFHRYKNVVTHTYRFYDMMLERLLNLIPEECHVVLVSDHGFNISEKRLARLPDEPLAPAHEHNPYGIITLKGPLIKKAAEINGSSLLDIAPTILSLYGIEPNSTMDGKSLNQIFYTPPFNHTRLASVTQFHDGNVIPVNDKTSEILLEQLKRLGYIYPDEVSQNDKVKTSIDINNFNLAQVFIFKKEYFKAIPILEGLIKNYQRSYLLKLFTCYEALNKTKKMKSLVKLLEERESTQVNLINFLNGRYYSQCSDHNKAIDCFLTLAKKRTKTIGINFRIAREYYRLRKYDEAIKYFNEEEEITQQNYQLFYFRAICKLHKKDSHGALNDLLATVNLKKEQPLAHYYIGLILFEFKNYDEAEKALLLSFMEQPSYTTFNKLKELYEVIDNRQAIIALEEKLQHAKRKEVIVVSGLPRSGTSLMMQMLNAGGLKCYTDNERLPDENNPNGYFEHELVKKLPSDNSWLVDAENKCIKVVSPLLFYLPDIYNYKVILMERDFNEIALSQKRMLQRRGQRIHEENYPLELMQAFQNNKERVSEWFQQNDNVSCLRVNFRDLFKHPEIIIKNIEAFLNIALHKQPMAKIINPDLYREKALLTK